MSKLTPNGECIGIMVDDQVVGMSAKPFHILPENDTEPKETYIANPYEITAHAVISDPDDMLRDLLEDEVKVDVTIQQEARKLPRKTKKAMRSVYRRNTKWKRKAKAYICHRQIRICDAEMVLTHEQQETLKATISGGTIEHGGVIPGEKIDFSLREFLERKRLTLK